MMKCSYCGYEYEDNQLKCPFCGSENTQAAKKRQEEALFSLDTEHKELNQMPEELLSQASHRTLSLGRILMLVVALLFILTIAGSFFWKFYSEYRTEKNLIRLESMMQEKDYAGIMALLDKTDSFDSAYDPYWEIYWAYTSLQYLEEDLAWFYSCREEGYLNEDELADILVFALEDCVRPLTEALPCLQDNLILGNEAALEDICQMAYDTLTQVLKLTDAEISELNLEGYNYDERTLLPYARLALERME